MGKELCFEMGNRQYLCNVGEEIIADYISNVKVGEEFKHSKVLLWRGEIGRPYLLNYEIKFKVIRQLKHKKLNILHLISQKRHRKRMGFRARYTLLKIEEVRDCQKS